LGKTFLHPQKYALPYTYEYALPYTHKGIDDKQFLTKVATHKA